MARSSDTIKVLASLAGLTPDQLIKAAGILYLAERGIIKAEEAQPEVQPEIQPEVQPSAGASVDAKVMQVLSVERALSLKEVADCVSERAEVVEEALKRLQSEGKVLSAKFPTGQEIYAVADDGTLDIRTLPEAEREWLIVNAYGNREKVLSYAKLYGFLKASKRAPPKRRAKKGSKERVLEALRGGAKRMVEVSRALNMPLGTVSWAIYELIKEGRVRRAQKGLYEAV